MKKIQLQNALCLIVINCFHVLQLVSCNCIFFTLSCIPPEDGLTAETAVE